MFFRAVQMILYVIYRIFFRIEITGSHHIPAQGAVVIASNHLSNWDPPLIGGSMTRMINFMAKEELFEIPIFGWGIRKFKAFPIKRGTADRTAIRYALNLLENGEILGIFPEGTRSKTGRLGSAEPGAALIIAKSGATVIPTALINSNKILSPKHGLFPKLTVRFGPPLSFPKGTTDKNTLTLISDTIMGEIARLQGDGGDVGGNPFL